MSYSNYKHIERTLTNDEIKELISRKHLLIAIFKYKFKNYELIGYLKSIK